MSIIIIIILCACPPFSWLYWVLVVVCVFALVAVCVLLIAAASLVAEHGLYGTWALVVAHTVCSYSMQALERRLSSHGAWA